MDRNVVKKLVYSITQFLKKELEGSSNLMEEGAESVEVAIQCLESAYGLNEESSDLSTSKSLYEIFEEGVSKGNASGASASFMNHVPTDEEKAIAESLKNEGNQLMREEKFDKALECYTKAIGKNQCNAVYYCNRAAAYSKLNNHKQAIEDCKKALLIDPKYSKAYGRMGLAYAAVNNPMEARECYKKALEIEPENENFLSNLQVAEEKLRDAQSQPGSGPGPQNSGNPFASLGGMGGFANLAGVSGGSGPPDLQGLLGNPALMNMASQLMSDPNMQNLMSSFMGNMGVSGGEPASAPPPPAPAPESNTFPGPGGPPGGMEALITAGRQLAEQIQSQNPDLIEQLRNRMGSGGPQGGGDSNQGPQNPPS